MKPSENLFLLIRSLSKAEKTYFKKFTALHVIGRKNNYIRLFDAIAKQKVYDEKAIVKRFPGESFTRNIAVYKNYLYKLILKSLRNFHEGSRSTAKIYELMRNAELLREKGLYSTTDAHLEAAEAIAEKHEVAPLHAMILRQRLELKIDREDFDHSFAAQAAAVLEKQKKLFEKAARENELSAQQSVMFTAMALSSPYGLSERLPKSFLKSVLKHLREENHPGNTVFGRSCIYWMGISFYTSKYDFPRTFEFNRKMIRLHQDHPHFRTERIFKYVGQLHNFLTAALNVKNFAEFNRGIGLLEQLADELPDYGKSKYYRYYIRLSILQNKAHYCFTARKFDDIAAIAKSARNRDFMETVDWYVKKEPGSGLEISLGMLNYFTAIVFFYRGDYRESIYWLNRLLSAKNNMFSELQHYISYVRILAHYHLGHDDLVDTMVKSELRRMKKPAHTPRFDSLLLNALNGLAQATRHARKKIFESLFQETKKMSLNDKDSRAFSYFEFREWIESNLAGKTMAEFLLSKQK